MAAKVDANPATIIRSMTFVGAHDDEEIGRVVDAGVDAVCFDLESKTPRRELAMSLERIPALAGELAARGIRTTVRTHALDDGARGELEAVLGPDVHCVQVPKAEQAAEVAAYCDLVGELEPAAGLPVGWTHVRPVVETALGIVAAFDIAKASTRIAYMGGVSGNMFGDLGASIGYYTSEAMPETLWLRTKVLVEVRAAGVPHPVGGGWTAPTGPEGLRAFAQENRNLGYTGMHCPPTPEAVTIANEVFTPSEEDLRAWVERYPDVLDEGGSAPPEDGHERPGLARLRPQVELARRLGIDF